MPCYGVALHCRWLGPKQKVAGLSGWSVRGQSFRLSEKMEMKGGIPKVGTLGESTFCVNSVYRVNCFLVDPWIAHTCGSRRMKELSRDFSSKWQGDKVWSPSPVQFEGLNKHLRLPANTPEGSLYRATLTKHKTKPPQVWGHQSVI